MERPGILKIGDKYFLKSFNLAIDIKETCLLSAVALLLALTYCCNQSLFDIKCGGSSTGERFQLNERDMKRDLCLS